MALPKKMRSLLNRSEYHGGFHDSSTEVHLAVSTSCYCCHCVRSCGWVVRMWWKLEPRLDYSNHRLGWVSHSSWPLIDKSISVNMGLDHINIIQNIPKLPYALLIRSKSTSKPVVAPVILPPFSCITENSLKSRPTPGGVASPSCTLYTKRSFVLSLGRAYPCNGAYASLLSSMKGTARYKFGSSFLRRIYKQTCTHMYKLKINVER